MGHAVSYEDDGSPQEQSRRKFMVNMVVGLSGVIGLVLGIPLVSTMIPDSSSGGAAWSPLSDDEFKKLEAATEKPVKVTFNVHTVDGYLPPADDEQFVWAIKTSEAKMRASRPELFEGKEKLPYPVVNMGFVVFSPVCPHLGCRYVLDTDGKFLCHCHGSRYDELGVHIAGPAQRGLDPLPLRDHNGKAEVTWIHYKGNEPDHVILSYT